MPNNLPFKNIGIAGIGLIGGSFAKSFASKGIQVYGYDANEGVLLQAISSEVFQGVTDDVLSFINFPLDLIYICLPVKSAIEFIHFLGKNKYNKSVTDASSTKSSILKSAQENNLIFCGGHPIKGKEKSGFINSDDGLFDGAKHILTSLGYKELDDKLKELHLMLNMEVIEMSAKEHDSIFANVSHLPHLISFCLMDTVLTQNKNALFYAGGGFRDFTRIAASDALMWSNIFFDNKDSLIECVENLEKDIIKWKDMIKKDKAQELYDKIEQVSEQRRKL